MSRICWSVSQTPRSLGSPAFQATSRPRRAMHARSGVALLLCVLVATVTSVAVLAIFQIARYETLETVARSHAAQARWLAHGAKEVAIARLLADATFRGEFKVEIPQGSGHWVTVQVIGDDQHVTVTARANVEGARHTINSAFTWQQLKDRFSLTHISQHNISSQTVLRALAL